MFSICLQNCIPAFMFLSSRCISITFLWMPLSLFRTHLAKERSWEREVYCLQFDSIRWRLLLDLHFICSGYGHQIASWGLECSYKDSAFTTHSPYMRTNPLFRILKEPNTEVTFSSMKESIQHWLRLEYLSFIFQLFANLSVYF